MNYIVQSLKIFESFNLLMHSYNNMITNKICTRILLKSHSKILSLFSKKKGLEENIKSKEEKKFPDNQKQQIPTAQGLLELSKMKFLSMQLFPASVLLTPTILSISEMYDPTFLLGELLVEKYCSLALLMNLDFQNDKRKAAFFLISIASLHTLTGYYSAATPLAMAFLTIIAPFKFCNEKEKYDEIESQRIKNMTHVRAIYFFIFTLLTTLKAMHYEATYKLDNKLKSFDEENLGITKPKQAL